jgi:iron(III) transport system ATP-binding protein
MSHWLQVKNIVCRYEPSPAAPVVDNLSFELEVGEIGCLLGSSGCGKTTVLRSIAGFQTIESGSIELGGRILSGAKCHLAPEKRQVGMVFQDYALFPHLTVCDNITFGLHKMPAKARELVCEELLELVKLKGFGHRYPHELSGGQQQRVALARALAPSPALLLLDEPLSSLDAELRRGLALEVRDILKRRGISAIMVTHDQEEAFAFADKIGVLHKGKLEQWDLPFNLYHEPKTRYVANFIGQGVFLPGFMRDANTIETELGLLQSHKHYPWLSNTAVEILLRPDDIVESPDSPYQAKIIRKLFAGTSTLYTLALPTGSHIEAALPSHHNFEIDHQIGIRVEADHLIAFARQDHQ